MISVIKKDNLNMKKAFTLAEVLLTLVIIGVVSAMTLPTLLQTTEKKENIARYKKALSTINQAIARNFALYGFNMASVDSNCINEAKDHASSVQSVCSIFNNALIRVNAYNYATLRTPNGTLYYQDLYGKGTTSDTMIKEQGIQLYFYEMITGEYFSFHSPHKGAGTIPACTLLGRSLEEALRDPQFQKYCIAFIDINGSNPPNKEVRCSDGKGHYTDLNHECVVNLKDITDVFPLALYDGNASPASAASRAVLRMQ